MGAVKNARIMLRRCAIKEIGLASGEKHTLGWIWSLSAMVSNRRSHILNVLGGFSLLLMRGLMYQRMTMNFMSGRVGWSVIWMASISS